MPLTGPNSSVVRAFTSGAVGCRFAHRLRHTKDDKNGTDSIAPLLTLAKRNVVPGRFKKACKCSSIKDIFVMTQ